MEREKIANAWPALNNLCNLAYENAKSKGFWERGPEITERLALIHSEVSEALECYREIPAQPYTVEFMAELGRVVRLPNGKPIGFASEIADVVIRCFDLCGGLEIDLGQIVTEKMAFNATRGHKHGKVC